MAITAAGVGSGLDIESIVSQLMQLERQPLVRLEKRESEYQAQVSAYGKLKSAISAFQDAMKNLATQDKFRIFSNNSSNENVLTASSDSSAAAGTYAIQIDRLAQNHKLGSAEFADTDSFGGGAGDSLTLTVGAAAMTVDLSAAKTLSEVRDAINNDANNPGVTATILNTGAGTQRLILTADESGYDGRVTLSYGGAVDATTFNFTTANKDAGGVVLSDLTQLDAAFSIDGYALTAPSNNVSGVIDGITLQLKQTGSANLTLSRDSEKITESAKAFVDAYNELHKAIADLGSDELAGESALRSIQSQLRGVINTPLSAGIGSFTVLSSVGITTDGKTGELVFKESDFTDALNQDYGSVSKLFAHDNEGFAFRFEALADSLLNSDGIVNNRSDGLNDRIRQLQDQQLDMEYRLELREKALRSQYAALDSLIGRLNSTSQFLASQLSSGNA